MENYNGYPGAISSKTLESTSDLKCGEIQRLPRSLVNLNPYLDLRFLEMVVPVKDKGLKSITKY